MCELKGRGMRSLMRQRIVRTHGSITCFRSHNSPPTYPSLGSTASQFDVMLYRSGFALQDTGHLSAYVRLPFSAVSPIAPPTITVGYSHSHSRACPLLFPFVSTSDSIGLDSMNGLASASCARCVESILIDKFSKARFFMPSPEFYGYVLFFAVSCLVFLLSFPSHMCPPFPAFLYSPSYRGSTSHGLPFCGTAHVVYYCSWLSFCFVFYSKASV